ncbi:EF-hand domain-containing protein [Novosphingobium naphthalenivorans]|uniref:EF-hand domain-containing protein n=1 Tax=Novosphingobium naphthalenivorans TaxID=273168 RepID=UPI0008326FA9|nr:EF-hand domain-containing protein [Novosphingobium naphthalenivorans]
MNRFLLGGLAALVMAGIGLFWWQGRAEVEKAAPPPDVVASFDPENLPSADPGEVAGPALPEATQLTREQRRFGRYDRNSDGRISRNEMLSTRTAAFRKLDKDGNNLLSFEEWAVSTVDKFDHADINRDDQLTPEEFARTAPPLKPKAKCSC